MDDGERNTEYGVRKDFSVIRYPLSVFLCIALCAAITIPVSAQTDLQAAIDQRIGRLQTMYGISFKYKDFPRRSDALTFSEIPEEDYPRLNRYLALFEEEITKYPPGFFKDQGVRGIGLAMKLFEGEKSVQGLYIPSVRVMFFDISRFGKNKAQQRHSIHHEIFHMMYAVKGGRDFPLLKDSTWASFNEPGFVYGRRAGYFRKTNPYNHFAPKEPGFVTYYAMESIQEDQAEVFACLMLEQNRRLVEKWAVKDRVLAKKIKAIKEFAKYYHSEMDKW